MTPTTEIKLCIQCQRPLAASEEDFYAEHFMCLSCDKEMGLSQVNNLPDEEE